MFKERPRLPENINKNGPIAIRAHRLRNYYHAYWIMENSRKSFIPKNWTARSASWEYAQMTNKRSVANLNSQIEKTKEELDYFGPTPDGERLYRAEMAALVFRFLTAEDDHVVQITQGTIDEVCKLCRSGIDESGNRLGGTHCRDPRNVEYDNDIFRDYFGKRLPEKGITTTVGQLRALFKKRMQGDPFGVEFEPIC